MSDDFLLCMNDHVCDTQRRHQNNQYAQMSHKPEEKTVKVLDSQMGLTDNFAFRRKCLARYNDDRI